LNVFLFSPPRVDDVQIEHFEKFKGIPVGIIRQGTREVAKYIGFLFKQNMSDPVYRSKIMIVGHEAVGKTALFNTLFKGEGKLLSLSKWQIWREYYYKINGQFLGKYDSQNDETPHKGKTYDLKTFAIEEESDEIFHIKSNKMTKTFKCKDKQERDVWMSRLRRAKVNSATHGIDVRQLLIDHAITRKHFATKTGNLELSVWDFAGQHEYYNNHHYFLSDRTVFLVVWNIADNETKSRRYLRFWLQSIFIHLTKEKNFIGHSIIVVGTHLDKVVDKEGGERRAEMVRGIAKEMKIEEDIVCIEVSCGPDPEKHQNLENLLEKIYTLVLSHSYMEDRIPLKFLSVERRLEELLEKGGIPIVNIREIINGYLDETTVKEALKLFTMWGGCVYFDTPELADTVFLEPTFLTKEVLGAFFNPANKPLIRGGEVEHMKLAFLWATFKGRSDFEATAKTLLFLMEKFEVCFEKKMTESTESALSPADILVGNDVKNSTFEDNDVPFDQRKTIVPSLLPEESFNSESQKKNFQVNWPDDPPHDLSVQIERSYLFNVLPMELISRLLVLLHKQIVYPFLARYEVLLFDKGSATKSWIRTNKSDNSCCIIIRGKTKELCDRALTQLRKEIENACSRYNGVTFTEAIRSPFSPSALLTMKEIEEDKTRPQKKRVLQCPDTRAPLFAEKLLYVAGHSSSKPAKVDHWWEKLFAQGGSRSLELPVEQGDPKKHFDNFLRELDPDNLFRVGHRALLDNPVLRLNFQNALELMDGKHNDTASIFRRQNWKEKPELMEALQHEDEVGARKEVLFHLAEYGQNFRDEGWNDGQGPQVVPMIQMLPRNLARLIIQFGFGMIPPAPDNSFGQGVYFTSSMKHAFFTQHHVLKDQPFADYVYLISLVAPGNSYPIIEDPYAAIEGSKMGKPCTPGYQSHYVLLQHDGYLPERDFAADSARCVDELMIADVELALPLFLLDATPVTSIEVPAGFRYGSEWVFESKNDWKGSNTFPSLFFFLQNIKFLVNFLCRLYTTGR